MSLPYTCLYVLLVTEEFWDEQEVINDAPTQIPVIPGGGQQASVKKVPPVASSGNTSGSTFGAASSASTGVGKKQMSMMSFFGKKA